MGAVRKIRYVLDGWVLGGCLSACSAGGVECENF